MRTSTLILAPLALLLAFNLAACGNKGPLVRPSADDIEAVGDVEEIEPDSGAGPETGAEDVPPTGDVPVDDDQDDDADTPPAAAGASDR